MKRGLDQDYEPIAKRQLTYTNHSDNTNYDNHTNYINYIQSNSDKIQQYIEHMKNQRCVDILERISKIENLMISRQNILNNIYEIYRNITSRSANY